MPLVKSVLVFSEILRASVSLSPCENLKRVPLLHLCPEDPECTHPTPVLLLGFKSVCSLLPTIDRELTSCTPHPDMLLGSLLAACARNLGVTFDSSHTLTFHTGSSEILGALPIYSSASFHVCLRSLVLSGLDSAAATTSVGLCALATL